jgi:hypothetical protein
MVVKLNDRLADLSGRSQDPLISPCMGELVGDVWPKFFYSLSFKSWNPTDDAAGFRKRMAGTWTSATATAATQFTFNENGRYGGAAAAAQYNRVSGGQVVQTTQGYFGDGAYSVNGNAIVLTPDGQPPQPGFIRLEDESKDGGKTWVEGLYLLRTSSVDGKEYEVRYTKR